MSRIAWGAPTERFFEAGADRGVLYLPNQAGVPWNGLTAVNEAPNGGEPKPYYIDGYKYLNIASAEEFKATLNAFSSPPEFRVCDGTISIINGLFATQQPRQPFSLCYRTRVGNGVQGTDFGYKIHVVYNALAAPSQRNNETLGDGSRPMELSWAISTTPPKMNGLRPTAHFVIDSRYTPPGLLRMVEDILYGSEEEDARLPDPVELATLFTSPAPIVGRNLAVNPDAVDLNGFTAQPGVVGLTYVDGWARFTLESSAAARIQIAQGVTFESGIPYRLLIEARANRLLRIQPRIGGTTGVVQSVSEEPHWFSADLVAGSSVYSGFLFSNQAPYVAGDYVEVRRVLYSTADYRGPHFSGSSQNTEMNQYQWEGALNNSPSVVRSWY